MKTNSWLVLAMALTSPCLQAQLLTPVTLDTPTAIEAGPHHRVWQRVVSDGLGNFLTNSFTEPATGLNYLNSATGKWEESQPQFQITKDGYALADKTQHKLIVSANLNTAVAVDLQSPELRFQNRVLGLSYFDPLSGNSVLLAEVKDCVGQLVAPNQIIWPDAFTDFRADYRLTLRRDGVEADVILREQPPSPELFGLSAQTAQLQVLTEFLNAPTPKVATAAVPAGTNGVPNSFLVGPNLADEQLSFGSLAFERGRAFSLDESASAGDGLSEPEAPVGKSWQKLQGPNGELRDFLIESVNYFSISPQLALLPQPANRQASNHKPKTRRVAMSTRELPAVPPGRRAKKAFTVALARSFEPGFAIDYNLVSSATNQTFNSDTTYYVK